MTVGAPRPAPAAAACGRRHSQTNPKHNEQRADSQERELLRDVRERRRVGCRLGVLGGGEVERDPVVRASPRSRSGSAARARSAPRRPPAGAAADRGARARSRARRPPAGRRSCIWTRAPARPTVRATATGAARPAPPGALPPACAIAVAARSRNVGWKSTAPPSAYGVRIQAAQASTCSRSPAPNSRAIAPAATAATIASSEHSRRRLNSDGPIVPSTSRAATAVSGGKST